jgi:hypothetical protein
MSPTLMRLERCFLSAFPQDFSLTFSVSGIGGESGVALVCAVIVGGGCGCGIGVSRCLDKNENFAHHILLLVDFSDFFEKRTQKCFFEKRTQKVANLKYAL